MKASGHDRAESVLQKLESEICRRLKRELVKVLDGRNSLFFFNEEFNPHEFPSHCFAESSNELVKLSKETIQLRQSLMLSVDDCIGNRFLSACGENADLANKHRLGPRRLAERLLSQMNDRTDAADG